MQSTRPRGAVIRFSFPATSGGHFTFLPCVVFHRRLLPIQLAESSSESAVLQCLAYASVVYLNADPCLVCCAVLTKGSIITQILTHYPIAWQAIFLWNHVFFNGCNSANKVVGTLQRS